MIACFNLFKYARRRLIFGLLFAFLFVYCIFSLLHFEKGLIFGNDFDDIDNINLGDNSNEILNSEEEDGELIKSSDKSLLWHMEVLNDGGNTKSVELVNVEKYVNNETSLRQCRNSIQDKFLIVDEKGYVCSRYELSNGCCNAQILENTSSYSVPLIRNRYTCKTCNPQGCCTIFEYCVSCCLDPKKIKKKKGLNFNQLYKNKLKLKQGEDILKLRLRSLDRFQLCLAACRTSSLSVHENTYKNPYYKYCYILQLSSNN
ncbi:PREDICTED: uncharacterized protein LOC105360012, partial [Ceratosolen solmsi marchali]|uniref:SREBP regulating gene protein n=1 Tax=Ceratosolen solmsi marchali TaxID=326594 RepID=A0AAJ6YC69_9HYME